MAFDLNTKLTEWLAPKQQDINGQSVVYSRPSTGYSVTITAILPDYEYTGAEGGSGAFDEYERLRLGIKVSELVLNGSAATPTRGDTVTFDSRTYGLAKDEEPVFTYLDVAQDWYVIEFKGGSS